MTRWQMQVAKNRLAEVVRCAQKNGPQLITVHGSAAVVVVAADEYFRAQKRSKGSLVAFFRHSPLGHVKLDLERSRDTGRGVEL